LSDARQDSSAYSGFPVVFFESARSPLPAGRVDLKSANSTHGDSENAGARQRAISLMLA
jgi:hypothetical protein